MKRKFTMFIGMLLTAMVISSCKADFNTVGIKMGNMLNGSEVTSQNNTTYYINDGDIYKNDKKIIEGDFSNINVVGEKLYFYDKSISSICKANSEGFKVERIAEIYTDNFVVQKDNIFVSILTGAGDENLESPSNYNVVRLKVTDRKLTSQSPQSLYEKGKLIGAQGDRVYIVKEEKGKNILISLSVNGDDEREITEIAKSGKAIVGDSGVYVMQSKDKSYGIYEYDLNGKLKREIMKLNQKDEGANAFNFDGENLYFETVSSEEAAFNNIEKYNLKSGKREVIFESATKREYKIGIGAGKVLIKERAYKNIEDIPKWKEIKKDKQA